MSSQEPLLMLHGMGCGPWVWNEVIDHLPANVHCLPLTLAGHRGGAVLDRRSPTPASEQMVDRLERELDAAGLDRVHVVGNSLGGWVALRLAERGRTLSTLALAPAGGWTPGSSGERLLMSRFTLGRQVARRLSRYPAMLASPLVRRGLMHPVVATQAAMTQRSAYALVRDMASCDALRVALGNPETRHLKQISEVPLSTTIAWAEHDRVLSGPWARRGFEHLVAEVDELSGAGHMAMLDDPGAVARLITDRLSARC